MSSRFRPLFRKRWNTEAAAMPIPSEKDVQTLFAEEGGEEDL